MAKTMKEKTIIQKHWSPNIVVSVLKTVIMWLLYTIFDICENKVLRGIGCDIAI